MEQQANKIPKTENNSLAQAAQTSEQDYVEHGRSKKPMAILLYQTGNLESDTTWYSQNNGPRKFPKLRTAKQENVEYKDADKDTDKDTEEPYPENHDYVNIKR